MEANNNGFQGGCPTLKRYHLCKQMVKKTKEIVEHIGRSNIEPFSHPAPLPGIQYESSENFVEFESRKVADDELMKALQDDGCHMIGMYGMGGSGKTTLVTQVGKRAEELNLFDKVISIMVSQTPNIKSIQGKLADMLDLKLEQESEGGRAQRIWMSLKEKKRILIIVDDLWKQFELRDVGIRLENDYKRRWTVLVTSRLKRICNSMGCQKSIHLNLLSDDESWALFKKHANIDEDMSSETKKNVCKECKRLPLAITTVGSSLKGQSNAAWEAALSRLKNSEAIDDVMEEDLRDVYNCLKLSYDNLKNKETELVFLICSMFPEDYEIPREDLIRYGIGLGLGGRHRLESKRSRIQAGIDKLLDSCLLLHVLTRHEKTYIVKMHDMVRDVALWIAGRLKDHKILFNHYNQLGTEVIDCNIQDYFAISSWHNENQISLELDAPNLQFLLLALQKMDEDFLDLSHLTFKQRDNKVKLFSVINQTYSSHKPRLSLPHSIMEWTNLKTVRLYGWHLGDISLVSSLTGLEVLDLRSCTLNKFPIEIGRLQRLKMLDLTGCVFQENSNGATGKCLQLEELYVFLCQGKCLSHSSIMDIVTHSKLQRFWINNVNMEGLHDDIEFIALSDSYRRFLILEKFDISNSRASGSNLLQIANAVSLSRFRGGCKIVIPDLIRVVGGMNNLSFLGLHEEEEIECIFNATSDSDNCGSLPPMLVALSLSKLKSLKELCRGPSQRFFDKLEKLSIRYCPQLRTIFPMECNLVNLKILKISKCMSGELLFSMSVAQSLHQLEHLEIDGIDGLKHIIGSGREQHSSNTSKELVVAPGNSRFVMPNLKKVDISNCSKVESLFSICCAEGLVQLQGVTVKNLPELKYVFGECDHMDHSSLQYQNQILLLQLELLYLHNLENLIDMCPKKYPAKCPSPTWTDVKRCPKFTMMIG